MAVASLMGIAENAGRKHARPRQRRPARRLNSPSAGTNPRPWPSSRNLAQRQLKHHRRTLRNLTRESAQNRFLFLLSTPGGRRAAAKDLRNQRKKPVAHPRYLTHQLPRGASRQAESPADRHPPSKDNIRHGRASVRSWDYRTFLHNSPCSGFIRRPSVMKIFHQRQQKRLNEIMVPEASARGSWCMTLSWVVPDPGPSINTRQHARPLNLIGYPESGSRTLLSYSGARRSSDPAC